MFISLLPQTFKEHTHLIKGRKATKKMRKDGMTRDTIDMPVYQDDKQTISCWTTSLWGRIMFLFTGRIWMQTIGQQPIIGLHIGEMFKTRSEYVKPKKEQKD